MFGIKNILEYYATVQSLSVKRDYDHVNWKLIYENLELEKIYESVIKTQAQ